MIEAILTDQKRRRWNPFRRRRFVLRIPQRWSEVAPIGRRERWWRWVVTMEPPAAKSRILRDLVPLRFRRAMTDLDFAALSSHLDWLEVKPDTENAPLDGFTHNDVQYAFPNAKGANVSCIEFALCDDYYKEFSEGNADALLRVSACLWREEDDNEREALRRGDARVPLYSKEEVEARVKRLEGVAHEVHIQALLWWVGMKMLVSKMYGNWLFEQDDEDDEDEPAYAKASAGEGKGPNFGWWGIFLDVAESGTFGPLDKVYQTSIHDICIFLVKKRAEANQAPEPKPTSTIQDEED
jgi:hypothetical protein